ncbi:hypothetical protein EV191_1011134 [Tamaricihabitans halophyticus]|uniref:Flagellar basal body-associated protein FliL n=1 Tax=Tamaricihabitans halophyticus TaxID=1262583 RepID=A0A4R2RBT1_9PSEU|nr:hypothetical protein [Tamaricihabitans halophyticus]TCP57181.1 hypothetical protein EV191_1011134 [Tamaricihabitans halophyticus]
MSWQEQLRQLDTELAHGRISADDHRKQRDELLAEASASAPAKNRPASVDERLRWRSSNPGAQPRADSTTGHTQPASGQPGAPDWPADAPTDWPETAATDWPTESAPARTSKVPQALLQPPIADPYADPPTRPHVPTPGDKLAEPVSPSQPSPGQPSPSQPSPGPPAQPGGGLPPLAGPAPVPMPSAAGKPLADDAELTRKPRVDRRGRLLYGGVAAGLVLALVAVGIWLSGDPAEPTAANDQVAANQQQAPGPANELDSLMPALPGVANENNSSVTVEKGRQLGLYTKEEATILEENNVSGVTYRGSANEGIGYAILVAENEDDAGAKQTTQALHDELVRTGFEPGPEVPREPDLRVLKRLSEQSNTYRVVYQSGDYTVRMGLAQMPAAQESALATEFEQMIGTVLEKFPTRQ